MQEVAKSCLLIILRRGTLSDLNVRPGCNDVGIEIALQSSSQTFSPLHSSHCGALGWRAWPSGVLLPLRQGRALVNVLKSRAIRVTCGLNYKFATTGGGYPGRLPAKFPDAAGPPLPRGFGYLDAGRGAFRIAAKFSVAAVEGFVLKFHSCTAPKVSR